MRKGVKNERDLYSIPFCKARLVIICCDFLFSTRWGEGCQCECDMLRNWNCESRSIEDETMYYNLFLVVVTPYVLQRMDRANY